jgi:MSHA pilin protein MshA
MIELVAIIVILAVLSAVALPRYADWSEDARTGADEAAIGAIRTSLNLVYVEHRSNQTGPLITSINDIAGIMHDGQLPNGITIVGTRLEDQRGNRYQLTAEAATAPARLTKVPGGGGGS